MPLSTITQLDEYCGLWKINFDLLTMTVSGSTTANAGKNGMEHNLDHFKMVHDALDGRFYIKPAVIGCST